MTREITKQALEAAIVRNCSPMLAGLKPACLFTFPGVFLAQGENVDKQELACSNRAKLLEELEPCTKALAPSGISLRVLTWRSCGALVYVYRPAILKRWIADAEDASVNAIDSLAAYDAPGPQEQAACQALGAALA